MRVSWKRLLLYALAVIVVLYAVGFAVFGLYGDTEIGLR
jgi:hypothetical protein